MVYQRNRSSKFLRHFLHILCSRYEDLASHSISRVGTIKPFRGAQRSASLLAGSSELQKTSLDRISFFAILQIVFFIYKEQ